MTGASAVAAAAAAAFVVVDDDDGQMHRSWTGLADLRQSKSTGVCRYYVRVITNISRHFFFFLLHIFFSSQLICFSPHQKKLVKISFQMM